MNTRATFTRMEHSTQQDWAAIVPEAMKLAATLALKEGRDEEYVVCALLHDIGDTLGSYKHPDVDATAGA
jgi:predicted HD phosphohydrolase